MITMIVFGAGTLLGFRLGAKYHTITNAVEQARAKMRGWLGRV
jgi:hypothetical protein